MTVNIGACLTPELNPSAPWGSYEKQFYNGNGYNTFMFKHEILRKQVRGRRQSGQRCDYRQQSAQQHACSLVPLPFAGETSLHQLCINVILQLMMTLRVIFNDDQTGGRSGKRSLIIAAKGIDLHVLVSNNNEQY
jgi:hypothetical protein